MWNINRERRIEEALGVSVVPPVVEIDPEHGDLLFLSDIQPQRTFDMFAFEEALESYRGKSTAAVFVVGDILENLGIYRQQFLKTWPLMKQRAVVIKLLRMLIKTTGTKQLYLIPGNHDVFMGGNAALETALMMWIFKDECEIIPTGEVLAIRYGGKNLICTHKLGRSYGSYATGQTPRMLKSAMDLIIQFARMGIKADTVITGHIHRASCRWNIFELLTLPGWNIDGDIADESRGFYVVARDVSGLHRVEPTTPILKEYVIRYMERIAEEAMDELAGTIAKGIKTVIPERVLGDRISAAQPIELIVNVMDRAGYGVLEILRFLKNVKPELFSDDNLPRTLEVVGKVTGLKEKINWLYHALFIGED